MGQYHSKKSVKEWTTIFFADESTFNINNGSVQYVRRIGERYDEKFVVGAPNRSMAYCSIWGGFSKDSFSPLVRIQVRLDSPTFIDGLTENFLPNKEDILPDGHLFQLDNASVHIDNIKVNGLKMKI